MHILPFSPVISTPSDDGDPQAQEVRNGAHCKNRTCKFARSEPEQGTSTGTELSLCASERSGTWSYRSLPPYSLQFFPFVIRWKISARFFLERKNKTLSHNWTKSVFFSTQHSNTSLRYAAHLRRPNSRHLPEL